MMRFLLGIIFAVALSASAQAATCYWVGGTGNFDNTNTASWASGTGGGAGTCAATGGIPKNVADIAYFDALSGGGTVTVCGASSANCPSGAGLLSITMVSLGAFTGTLDFAANDPDVTLASRAELGGAGTKTINLGDGTWTIGGTSVTVWDCGSCTTTTVNAGASTIHISAPSGVITTRTFASGGKTYHNLIISSGQPNIVTITGGPSAYNSITVTAPSGLLSSTAITVANGISISGTSATNMAFFGIGPTNPNVSLTISGGVGTCNWCIMNGYSVTGTMTTTNTVGMGNTGVTINPPPSLAGGSGGGKIIGG